MTYFISEKDTLIFIKYGIDKPTLRVGNHKIKQSHIYV